MSQRDPNEFIVWFLCWLLALATVGYIWTIFQVGAEIQKPSTALIQNQANEIYEPFPAPEAKP